VTRVSRRSSLRNASSRDNDTSPASVISASSARKYYIASSTGNKATRFLEMTARLRPNQHRDSIPPVVTDFGQILGPPAQRQRGCLPLLLIVADNRSVVGSRVGRVRVDRVARNGSLSNISEGALVGFTGRSSHRRASCAATLPNSPGKYQFTRVTIVDRAGNQTVLSARNATQRYYRSSTGRTRIPVIRFRVASQGGSSP